MFASQHIDHDKIVCPIAVEVGKIEPDGQPNARNIPTSTLNSNIYYHLGLAQYLKGEFEAALSFLGVGVQPPRFVGGMQHNARKIWHVLEREQLGQRAGEQLPAAGRRHVEGEGRRRELMPGVGVIFKIDGADSGGGHIERDLRRLRAGVERDEDVLGAAAPAAGAEGGAGER